MSSDSVTVVLPAYNAAGTLRRTIDDLPKDGIDRIILVDDGSQDDTASRARSLGLEVHEHTENRGYGGNQKTCYETALKGNAEIIVMLHPDYQYDSRVVPLAVGMIQLGICDVVFGNRIRSRREVMDGGMPLYKYVANRLLTIVENIVLGQNLGECHSGFRVYRREVLESIPFMRNSDDFVFDSQMLAQAAFGKFRIGDIPVPVRYFQEASSINFSRSIRYGFGTIAVLFRYLLARLGVPQKLFPKDMRARKPRAKLDHP